MEAQLVRRCCCGSQVRQRLITVAVHAWCANRSGCSMRCTRERLTESQVEREYAVVRVI
jgi:hypothetical protein